MVDGVLLGRVARFLRSEDHSAHWSFESVWFIHRKVRLSRRKLVIMEKYVGLFQCLVLLLLPAPSIWRPPMTYMVLTSDCLWLVIGLPPHLLAIA